MSPHVADIINGSFETAGAVCCWSNVRAYAKARTVKGVYWPTTLFFSIWGLWNLLYYPSLGQWYSTVAGALLTGGNLAWVLWVLWDKVRARNVLHEAAPKT